MRILEPRLVRLIPIKLSVAYLLDLNRYRYAGAPLYGVRRRIDCTYYRYYQYYY